MIEQEREELLSAYLDGEVSPEERARVEQWLTESPELRQLREELLSLRADLRALPKHPVGHDLAAVVMNRSTSAVPADPSSRSTPTKQALAVEELPRNIVVEWWNRGSNGRRFFWPVLAVAAALAILVFDARQRPEDFEVAQAPPADSASELEESTAAPGAPAQQPNISAAPESAAPAEDSNTRGSGAAQPVPPPAAEMRSPANRRYQDLNAVPRDERNGSDRSLMKPGEEPSREAAPAAVDFYSKREAKDAQSKVSQLPTIETIVCSVTPEYLEERQFEKMLDANKVTWKQVPISLELQRQAAAQAPRTAPLESFGKSPLQALYVLDVKSEKVNSIISQVPQADKLMEGNQRAAIRVTQQQAQSEAGGVQVMLVAPIDVPTPATAPAARPAR